MPGKSGLCRRAVVLVVALRVVLLVLVVLLAAVLPERAALQVQARRLRLVLPWLPGNLLLQGRKVWPQP